MAFEYRSLLTHHSLRGVGSTSRRPGFQRSIIPVLAIRGEAAAAAVHLDRAGEFENMALLVK